MVGDQRDHAWRPPQPGEVASAVERMEPGLAQRCGIPDVVQPRSGDQRFGIAGIGESHGDGFGTASHTDRVLPPLATAFQQRLCQLAGVANEPRQSRRAAHSARLWRCKRQSR
jgi:hypothetical protein